MASIVPPTLPQLPSELLNMILEHLVPNSTNSTNSKPLVLPQSHPTTKALLALTRTCRATHLDAIRLLYTYCVHINTVERLHQISTSLSYMIGKTPTHLCDIPIQSSISVESVNLTKHRMSAETFSSLTAHPRKARLSSLPIIEPHTYIISLHVETRMNLSRNLESETFLQSLHNLFTLVAPSLRNLFVNYNNFDREGILNHKPSPGKPASTEERAQAMRNLNWALVSVVENLSSVEMLWTTGTESLFRTQAFKMGGIPGLEVPVYLNWPKLRSLVVPDHWSRSNKNVWKYLPLLVDTVIMMEPEYSEASVELWHDIRKYHPKRKLDIYVVDYALSPDGTLATSSSLSDRGIPIQTALGIIPELQQGQTLFEDGADLDVREELVLFRKVIRTGGHEESLPSNIMWVKSQLWSGSFPRNWTFSNM